MRYKSTSRGSNPEHRHRPQRCLPLSHWEPCEKCEIGAVPSPPKKNQGGESSRHPGNYLKNRAQPTLSVLPDTIGMKSLTSVFGMGTSVSSPL